MRRCSLLASIFAMVLSSAAIAAPLTLYIAPNGNDAWSGALSAPNAANTDGPFASLSRARDEIRKRKAAAPLPAGGITVLIAGGNYTLPQPLDLDPQDSGAPDAPIVYAAANNDEKPVFSGGVILKGFQPDPQGRWQLQIPDVQKGQWTFSQLFVNNNRRLRPRWPRADYSRVAGGLAPSPANAGRGSDRFRFRTGDIRSDWKNLTDVEVLIFHNWNMSRLRIADVDDQKRIVNFTGPTCTTAGWGTANTGHRFIAENVLEELKDPGQWYLDRKTGVLTYIPLPGEQLDKTTVVAPRIPTLVSLAGKPAQNQYVEHITFRGLSFEHTNWALPEKGYSVPQAEVTVEGAIKAHGARYINLESCNVRHVGTYAIEFADACDHDVIDNCEMTDLGAGGVKIGITRPDEKAIPHHCNVRNCLIAGGGRVHPAGIGVWLGFTYNVSIEHNDIHDFYYTGVSMGWMWGYKPTFCHDNLIAGNHIFNIGQAVLSDMGAIYTLGFTAGSVLRGNLMHDINSTTYGGWGIYFDEGTAQIRAENNLVYRTKTGGFHQHYGQDNTVVNNIFVDSIEHQLQRSRAENHLSFTFEHNIVAWNSPAPLLSGQWMGDHVVNMDYNVYFNGGATPLLFAGMSLDEWRKKTGRDAHSVIADPQFVDPAHDDYRLKDTSPALKLGFKPFDISAAGRPGSQKPLSFPPAFPTFPKPIGPSPISEDFEETPLGQHPEGAVCLEDAAVKSARVAVTDETAATGKHSLKFTDAPGQKNAWDPHMFYEPHFKSGVLEETFSLRIEAGAHFQHAWRTGGHPYHTGPSIGVTADGAMTTAGRKLMDIPRGQWVKIQITAGVGPQATGAWDLTVTPPNAAPQHFEQLPCEKPFDALEWLGYVSAGTQPGVFYIDDITLRPK